MMVVNAQAMAERLLQRCLFARPSQSTPAMLAVSGGPDSMALLILAACAGLEAVAVHVDHGLRPGAQQEAELVRSAARRFGVGFELRKVEIDLGPDLEARARHARYSVLPEGVLTGHTMDDQAETMLINLLRGAGIDGLAAMEPKEHPPGAPRVVRPLLRLRRTETASLCAVFECETVQDPSNRDPRFLRNRVRSELVPFLSQLAGRDVVPVIARQARVLARERDYLEWSAACLDPTDTASLKGAPVALAKRALRSWLRDAPGRDHERHPPSFAELARVWEVVQGRSKACQLAGGRRVQRRSGRLQVVAGPKAIQGAQ